MLGRNIKKDQKGIAGFFFDTPVLLLIIVLLFAFTTSLYQMYVPIQEEKDRIAQDRRCLEIKNRVQDYDQILHDEKDKFSMRKLEALEEEKLESQIRSGEDYRYNLTFEVLESEKSWSFGENLTREEINSESGVSSYRTPVSLVDEGRSSHLGKLKVNVWRG